MIDTKHTPGPWTMFGQYSVMDHTGLYIKLVGGGEQPPFQPEEQEANARLIAAAPELLEVLETIERVDVKLPFGLLGQVRAVIAKAKGGAA